MSEHKRKKRSRDEDESASTCKTKRSKKVLAAESSAHHDHAEEVADAPRPKKSKRRSREVDESASARKTERSNRVLAAESAPRDHAEKVADAPRPKKSKKRKDQSDNEPETVAVQKSSADVKTFPFYTQTVSLYLPLFPSGFGAPLTAARKQHLDPMLFHYAHALRGVPLAYRNVSVGERPMRAADPPRTDDDAALLEAAGEYAVGWAYVTADFDMFMPARGALMEGRMNLQTEGHIGLVCFERFNASVEAKRLPRGWRWVDDTVKPAAAAADTDGDAAMADEEDDDDDDDDDDQGDDEAAVDQQQAGVGGAELELGVAQLPSTGYWTDAHGRRVAGTIRFRIQAFDAGVSGEQGYLSIRGTLLDAEAERRLAAQERAQDRERRERQNPYGLLRPVTKRLPESSMTRFVREEGEGEGGRWLEG
ncbi:hypothetical protein P8C59_003568 [Phyllachora maydis]|uniref:DNA-directed RNA polymerase subunit n=1 Tax=Phyllachora maydis TaxID=1825666 RepID=A0AAD9M9E4_9PEZI|nr:hypothetical protein P8C59_003568 [Phyllachora maydis]